MEITTIEMIMELVTVDNGDGTWTDEKWKYVYRSNFMSRQ